MKDRARPLPDPMVACPWCGDPVELGTGSAMRCPSCRLVVEVTGPMPARRRRSDRAA
jgi:endogenous inhibitor of DNA gyrase (YacG/DUF329 family)